MTYQPQLPRTKGLRGQRRFNISQSRKTDLPVVERVKELTAQLHSRFPETKFEIMLLQHNGIRVYYHNGPAYNKVQAVLDRYRGVDYEMPQKFPGTMTTKPREFEQFGYGKWEPYGMLIRDIDRISTDWLEEQFAQTKRKHRQDLFHGADGFKEHEQFIKYTTTVDLPDPPKYVDRT